MERETRGVASEESSSSNWPELVAIFKVLYDTLMVQVMLHLCDNQSILKAVYSWIGEGGNATLFGAQMRICWQQLSKYCNLQLE